jgi:hypothetical protein
MTSGPELPTRSAPVEGGGAVVVVDLGTVVVVEALVVVVDGGAVVVVTGSAPRALPPVVASVAPVDPDPTVVGDDDEAVPKDFWQPPRTSAAMRATIAGAARRAVR